MMQPSPSDSVPAADDAATPRPPAVKICGVTRPGDARVAFEAGAGYVGAVLVPSTPRAIDASKARAMMNGIPLPLAIVICDLSVAAAAAAARESGAAVIQLHGDESPEMLDALRQEGDWALWKALRVREAEALEPAFERYAARADGILLDGWHPTLRGGSGARFSWTRAAGFRNHLAPGVKMIIAGGLTPENVPEAIRLLRPDIVDTSSGVEASPGVKDSARVRAFIYSARNGFDPS